MRFSRRSSWEGAGNRITAALEERRRGGAPILDLSEANPTRVGLSWAPDVLAAVLGDATVARYDPDPRGPAQARAEVVRALAERGAAVDPAAVLLTASTSEGYAALLKLLCDPGDSVLVPAPSYPLHDVLCRLEAVEVARYPLRFDGAWHVDVAALAAALTERVRAVVVVSPANPTGAVLSPDELHAIEGLCGDRGVALVGDEVFADTATVLAPTVASVRRCLAFQLGGLSKSCGLPQLKGAWIAAAGPEAEVGDALERLDAICDASLSLSAPAALAIARLLPRREEFLAPLRARLATNRDTLRSLRRAGDPFDVVPSAGGWSAVLRIPETLDEESLCLALLVRGVLVQPGFFYDFERSGYVVVSLLPEPPVFAAGAEIVVEQLRRDTGT